MDYSEIITVNDVNGYYSLASGESIAVIAAFMKIISIVLFIAIAIELIANYFVFKKMGEKGWKGFIPFYNLFTYFKNVWDTNFFWAAIGLIVAETVISYYGPASLIITSILLAFRIAMLVIVIKLMHKLSKSFGHGGWFTVGLVLCSAIFKLILAFGKSEFDSEKDVIETTVKVENKAE